MYIYKLMAWSDDEDNEGHLDAYLASDELYDNDEFKNLCNKAVEEAREHCKEVTNYTMKQTLILHHGFKELPIIQTFSFNEEYLR